MINFLKKEIPEVALIHDWFLVDSFGGGEKVTFLIDKILSNKFSNPDLFCLVESITNTEKNVFLDRQIKTSFIQNLPFGKKNVQYYLPIIPFAIEQLNLEDYKLIISSSHLAAKGVITSPDQCHIAYIHTPMRYAWDQMNIYLKS